MNRYDHESERGVVIEEELYEQNKTHVKQLLMKIFAVRRKFVFVSNILYGW